jgi:transposase-like protein
MARHRSHSIEFKRQVAQEFMAGETLHALARRHDVSRNLIRVWVKKLETGAFDDDARAADLCVRSRPCGTYSHRRNRHGRDLNGASVLHPLPVVTNVPSQRPLVSRAVGRVDAAIKGRVISYDPMPKPHPVAPRPIIMAKRRKSCTR